MGDVCVTRVKLIISRNIV